LSDPTPAPDATSDAPAPPERSGLPLWLYGTLVGVVVVALGIGVMVGLVWITDSDEAIACAGAIEMGYAPDISAAAAAEPDPQFIDERCKWWYAIDPAGDLVAYKTTITGRDCSVSWDYDDDLWRCGSQVIDESMLEQWPSRVVDLEDRPRTFVVDFGTP
jgi:hypothetical protein